MLKPINWYSDAELGLDLTYERNNISQKEDKNYELSKLKTSITTALYIQMSYIGTSKLHTASDNIMSYHAKSVILVKNLENSGYEYLDVLRSRLVENNQLVKNAKETFAVARVNTSKTLDKIDALITANVLSIDRSQDSIDQQRRTAYRNL